MSKISRPKGPLQVFLLAAIAVSVCYLVSCNQGAGGEQAEPPINADTVKNHLIPIGEAVQLTANFRAATADMDKKVPHFSDSMDFGHAEAFPADVFRELLKQTDSVGRAVGIRIYYGRDASGKIRQIMVPYDSLGNDIVNHIADINIVPKPGVRTEALKVSDGQAAQNGSRCPTVCGNDSSGLY
ncbi:MAG TPA: hypothetical protein VG101_07715 [Puia sp.]|jgi:hypothetical protein|nr:hypothetical protein [Puia sp.]